MRRIALIALLAAMLFGTMPRADGVAPPGASNCPVFPNDNYWHADVSALPVHARTDAWIASMGGPDRRLHPDFGPSGSEMPYGIPYEVVDSSRAKVAVSFEYDDESDAGPYPFGPDTPIEGGTDADGDRHALMIDRDTCRLYELFAARWNDGAPTAGSGAVFDLRSNALRPAGWTSADAAGLPVFAGLVRRDEVLAGNVDHAIRITAQRTSRAYLWPARHYASTSTDPNLPPMGAWFRLKSSFDISRYSAQTQTILRAFKKHGAIVADNGSNWYFTGSADAGWETAVLDELKSIPAGAFEAVDTASLMVDANSGQVRLAGQAGTPPAPTTTTAAPPQTTAPSPASTHPRVPSQPSSALATGRGPSAPALAGTPSTVATTTIVPADATIAPEGGGDLEQAAPPAAKDARRSPAPQDDLDAGGFSGRAWLLLGAILATVAVIAAVVYFRTRSAPATSTVTSSPSE